jgi:cell division transport system permease protein
MVRGAILSRTPLTARLHAHGRDHARTLISSLGKLYRTPVSSTMTTAVIGIALALPGGLYLLLANLQAVAGGWQSSARISLFLELDTPPQSVEALGSRLRRHEDVTDVQIISAKQALHEFRANSGFGSALNALPENPLPPVLVVSPALSSSQTKQTSALVAELKELPEVDQAQLDMQWLERLHAMMDIARRGVTVIALLLGLAVLLIVGNTIRLDIQNRREEIEVVKLIGATDAFIRRPFLYGGMWYGLLGGLLAWLLIGAAMLLMAGPAQHLALLYDSKHQLLGPGFKGTFLILSMGAALGLAGSWLAVRRHLSAIEPR